MIDALPLLLSDEGYQISRSVRLRSSATAYFSKTFAAVGNQQTATWSGWVKRGKLGGTDQTLFAAWTNVNNYFVCYFASADTLRFVSVQGGAAVLNLTTSAVFRDPSAWYHIVLKLDTTNATAANRAQIYVNGVLQTVTGTNPSLNANLFSYVTQGIGYDVGGGYVDGYLTEVNLIDGQALTPSSFGETNPVTGVWQPKKYTGTYGTNGFYLNFSDNSAATAAAIGKDYSGNGNNWTPNNISVTAGVTYDSMLDVPTLWADGGNGRGNYCTLNPLDFTTVGTISEANLRFAQSSLFSRSGRATIGVASGKWYWEVTNLGGNNSIGIGNASMSLGGYCGQDANGWSYFINGDKYNNSTATAYGASYTTNDVIGVALDMDAGTLTFYKNGVSQGQAFSSLSGTMFPAFSASSVSNVTFVANFGQRPFSYTPPTGFKALNTLNLPEPTISNGANYMAATTYTGTGSALSVSNAVNGVSFQPDFVWTKPRSTAVGHTLFDSLRGVTKYLQSNTTGAEGTAATSLTAFNSDGFTVNSDTSTGANGVTYVGWQWKEGATQGFDIVTYTGTGATLNVSHNLGVVPSMIITKSRSATGGWPVYHVSIGATGAVQLESTGATNTTSAYWNNTAPTSTQFTLASGLSANGTTYVAYLFAAVAGYSAFGSYTGNGSADGTFVYLGFRPRFVLFKRTDSTASWYIYDTSRNTFNTMNNWLSPNQSVAENTSTTWEIDIVSNGFKIRNSGAFSNANGGTYIFAAFAEHPFKNALAR